MAPDLFSQWKSNISGYTNRHIEWRRKMVSFTKGTLIGFAVLMVIALVWIANFNQTKERFNLSFSSVEEGENDRPMMINPKLQGMDAKGNPYTVTAKTAAQIDAENVELRQLQADITTESQNWVTIFADEGSLNSAADVLFVRGNVRLFHDAGYQFNTESALVDMANEMVKGEKPVRGTGLLGSIQSNAFQLWSKQHHIRFDRRVKVVIYGE